MAHSRLFRPFAILSILAILALACNLAVQPPTSTPKSPVDTPVVEKPSDTPIPPVDTPTVTHTIHPTTLPSPTHNPNADPNAVDPGEVQAEWEAQTCPATVLAKQDDVKMSNQEKFKKFTLKIDVLYMLVQGSNLLLTQNGQADVDYGGGHKITIFAPADGTGKMQIVEWNGARQVAILAGAGHVLENDTRPECRVTVNGPGDVTLTGTGTEYAFVALPATGSGPSSLQMVVFDGSVSINRADGKQLGVINQNQMGIYSEGQIQGIFDMTNSKAMLLRYLTTGKDLFGNPINTLKVTPTPYVTDTPWVIP